MVIKELTRLEKLSNIHIHGLSISKGDFIGMKDYEKR